MTFRKKVEAQYAHILSLRTALGLITAVCLVLAYGWWSAPRSLTVHVPPDLRSGSTRLWWDVPPENVYAFGFYIFQQLQRWEKDGDVDYQDNIDRLTNYLTPSCKEYLQKDYELRRNAGELRKRERSVSEIPGRGISDPNLQRVVVNSINDWTVKLDLVADEYVSGERVKRALSRYPLSVVRTDADPEKNPYGLMLNCYASDPQRIEVDLQAVAGAKP
ncbi:PFL_4703 family integrating conjugative element protein [Pseudomonas sp. Je.1.5.c]|uniref:PFL_4703 family integrating conjugative element protein n=1 Tax=Pseudomonas sp. Je.1.5.c TaxID=3142839 RepID=UPI003DA812C6